MTEIPAEIVGSFEAELNGICLTWDHSFGLMPEERREGLRRCFRQIAEHHIYKLILAAEKRGEERERERLANMLDPEIGLPSDRLLRVIHADVETRGRKNNKFAVTVHHRNIVLSAVAAAIRKGPDK